MKVIFKNCSLEFQKLGVEFTSSQFTVSKRVNPNGRIFDYSDSGLPQSSWCYSAQFDVENMTGKTVKLRTNVFLGDSFGIAFFSETPSDATFMSADSVACTQGTEWNNLTATVPSGARYIWVTCGQPYLDDVSGGIE